MVDREGRVWGGGIREEAIYTLVALSMISDTEKATKRERGGGAMLVGKAASTINKTMEADADLTHGRWGR